MEKARVMVLVEIRCKGRKGKRRRCGVLLGTVDRVPGDWGGATTVPACPDHGWHTTGPIGEVRRELADRHDEVYPPAVQRSVVIRYEALRPGVEWAMAHPSEPPWQHHV